MARPMATAAAAVLLVPLAACYVAPAGPVRNETRTVELEKAEMVRVDVNMAAGELRMGGGAKNLLDAQFHTNLPAPEVRYNETGFRGRLHVQQRGGGPTIGNVENNWDLRLNNDVALDLEVALGAGESDLDFSSLSLRGVDIRMGAGELKVDLTGDYKKSFEVRIRGGVGEANIRLPSKVGVMVNARGGLGGIGIRGSLRRRGDSYVNDAYEKSKITVQVDVRGGIGAINLIGPD